MEKNILITGASSGFGLATARKFAKNGWNIIFCGRREQRIRELEEELKSMSNIKFLGLVLDVRNRNDVESTIASLPRAFSTLDVLINNAGLAAGLDLFDEANPDDWEQMIDTNIKGLLYM